MANKTDRRGRGFDRYAITALTDAERSAFRAILIGHGFVTEGGKAHELEFALSLVSGELATVLLPQENPGRLIEWLEQQATALDASDYWLSQDVAALASQLRDARNRALRIEDGDVDA